MIGYLINCHYTDKITFILGWQDEVDKILKEEGKFVKTEDAPDSLSLYEETTSCTNNPLKPFDSQPQVSDNLPFVKPLSKNKEYC